MRLSQAAFFIFLIVAMQACTGTTDERVLVFHAGSLSYPMRGIAAGFESEFPNIKVLNEAAGSVHSARKITDLKRRADIMASADYQLINSLLVPQHATFNILFATNSMVLAFNEHSAFAGEITADNWIEILHRKGVKNGASDPNADPCGYRTRLMLQLAEMYYDQTGLEKLLSGPDHYQRPKETDLLALLETRTIDYIFIYESVAVQHGLHFITLPDSINLSDPALNDWYAKVSVDIRGSHAMQTVSLQGEAITYGITIPFDAPNPDAALNLLAWLLTPEKGGLVLKQSGQQPLTPAPVYGYDALPEKIKTLTTPIY